MHLLRIREYGPPQPLILQLSELTGMSIARSEAAIVVAGERLRVQHRLRNNPIQIVGGLVRVEDVAGVVSLTTTVDLEMIPKFVPDGADWASDVLFLSLFTKYGRLDPLRPIAAGPGKANALAELAARTLLGMIRGNARTPLRQRQKVTFQSFEPDGEIDAENMLAPEDEGWVQSEYRLTLDNRYVATLAAACRLLVPHVRNIATRSLLSHQIARLGRQTADPLFRSARMPPRLSRWQDAIDLASALIADGGLSPLSGRLSTLGFTISTWRTWETLIERALVIGMGGASVALQPTIRLGSSARSGVVRDVVVQPDAVVTTDKGVIIADAKYKGRADQPLVGISTADRYEVLGFMMASNSRKAALIYPAAVDHMTCGNHHRFERLTLPTGCVSAHTIGISGISEPGGFAAFTQGVRRIVEISGA